MSGKIIPLPTMETTRFEFTYFFKHLQIVMGMSNFPFLLKKWRIYSESFPFICYKTKESKIQNLLKVLYLEKR